MKLFVVAIAVMSMAVFQVTSMPVYEDCERCREFDVSDSEHSLCSFGCSYYLKTTLPDTADNTEFQQLAQRLLPILRLMRQFHSSLADDDTEVEIEQHDDDPFSRVQLNHETMELEPLNPTEDYPNEPVFTAQIELVDYPTLPEVMPQEPTRTSHVSISTGSVMPDSTEELDQDFLRLLSLNPAEELINFEDTDDDVEELLNKDMKESLPLPSSSIVFEISDEDRSRINKEEDDEDLEELSEILGLSLDPKVSPSSAPTTTVATPELVSPTTSETAAVEVKPTDAMTETNDSEESDDFNEIPDEQFHPEDKKMIVTSNDVRDYFDHLDDNHVVKRYKKKSHE